MFKYSVLVPLEKDYTTNYSYTKNISKMLVLEYRI